MQMAFVDDLAQATHDVGFELVVHGEVGFVPVTQHAEADEIFTLAIDLFGRVLATLFAEGFGIDLVAGLANFFSTINSMGRPWQSQPGT